jgi:NAD(P)-dependent dehydrogenase (short-subunit alcohol dehydrogenase family)
MKVYRCHIEALPSEDNLQPNCIQTPMKNSRAALQAAQIVTGIVAAAAAYALMPRPQKRHPGKVVLITGGSRGLGFALAERYGRSGAKLVLAARNLDELSDARHSLLFRKAVQSPDDIFLVPADLTDAAQATLLIEQTISHFGRIDILINNAGVIEVGPVENQPIAAYRRAMATNFFAALYTTHAALPHMLSRKPRTGDTAIVNIASIGGKFAMPHVLPYVASKFALVGFSEGLHAELRHKGIRVTTVCPGLMRTGGEAHAHYTGQIKKEQRWFNLAAKTPGIATSVQHAANKIYEAVAAGRAEITITPQAWLAARVAGIAPSTTQYLVSLTNHLLLPAPSPTNHLRGFTLSVSTHLANEAPDPLVDLQQL